jgi:hypothetical protein
MVMRWVTLRSFGNSRAVQLSAIFPFVGYLILFNDDISRYLSMQALDKPEAYGLIDRLWTAKLYFIYFGLMFLGIGSFIYQWSCPFIIKKHPDSIDYIKHDSESVSETAVISLGRVVGIPYNSFAAKDERDEAVMDIMRAWYADQSKDKQALRIVVTIFFGAGSLLLAVPSLLTAYKVLLKIAS